MRKQIVKEIKENIENVAASGNSVINSLKRLERAGLANSKTTEKMREAASEVATKIINTVPENVELPRGYKCVYIKSNVGGDYFLRKGSNSDEDAEYYGDGSFYVDGIGKYLHGDFHAFIPEPEPHQVAEFAQDIAEGLLDEIAEFLEKRANDYEQKTAKLQSVA